ncbi:rare lipoA family protein [Candidatus Endolissoclinum faulkneri L2]|uniref:Endolytic peptidoglycan transglycosylase RlpA n=1 Tax=Candidatus Endolissoclinum faulkneri L2 TaxID=1193729 RepID=K7YNK1_9PROT|nr:septal ring lytic transglycosylase RlpA family protein [Candidatus Endolissoclinum faulkneri]AFX99107.1 rare lipoA family protein [Candidatus Endolissoclinum faulkneri L2]
MILLQSYFLIRPWFPTIILIVAFILTSCSQTDILENIENTNYNQRYYDHRKRYKLGAAYKVQGVWYYPKKELNYSEVGIASWYGPGFNGRKTANGEIFNDNKLTAAHRTLPMPSLVRVTNLINNRSLIVRINDRGPFSRGRIIDLSRRSAKLLGFVNKGTARVRVEVVKLRRHR